MAKSVNQKGRILALQELLRRETDEQHLLSIPQILQRLEAQGITVERKSLYDDIDALRASGEDIQLVRGRCGGYFVASRLFELPELKLLVDAVQASRFITARKSSQLIKKLESLTSVPQAGQLQREVSVNGRVKSMNESIYYEIDSLHAAISAEQKIRFLYSEWAVEPSAPGGFVRQDKHGGKNYCVSPWALIWMEENYYLIGFEEEVRAIRHFRVDKMHQIHLLNLPRIGQSQFEKFDLARYTKSLFGMFSGEPVQVKMEFDNSLVGVVVDRFGKDVLLLPAEQPGRFAVYLEVVPGPTFFGWVLSFGDAARILSPQSVAQQLCERIEAAERQYR